MRKHNERKAVNACGRAARRAACAFGLPVLLLLSCSSGVAQSTPAYQQSLVAIQQQIEAGNLDEARSMIAGALAFFVYACAVSFILMRYRPRSLVAAGALSPIWFAVAFTLWAVWLRK